MSKFKEKDILAVCEPRFVCTEPVPRYAGTWHYLCIVQKVWEDKSGRAWYTLTIIHADTKELSAKKEIIRLQANIDRRGKLYEGAI